MEWVFQLKPKESRHLVPKRTRCYYLPDVVVVAHAFYPSSQEARASEFESSLVYIASSRVGRAV